MPVKSEILSVVQNATARVLQDYDGDYRSLCSEAYRFYRGQHKDDIDSALRFYFPNTMFDRELVPDTTNFCRKIVNRPAKLWDLDVERVYHVNDDILDPDSDVVLAFDSQWNKRKNALQELDRRSYLFRTALMYIGFDQRKQRLAYRLINPSDVWVIPGDSGDPDDIQNLDAIIYELASTGDMKRFCFWSKEYQFVYEGGSFDTPDRIEDDRSENDFNNPLGLLPFVVAREDAADGRFFSYFEEDIIDVSRMLNIAESLQTGNVWFQGYSPLVVPEGTQQEQIWSRGTALQEPVGEGSGQIRFLTKDTPFDEVSRHLQRKLQVFAMTRDLPSDDFSIDSAAPESGFSKLMSSLSLLDLRKSRIGKVADPVEEQLVEVEGALIRYHLRVNVPENIGVYTSFPDVSFPLSLKEKRDAQRIEVEIGLTNTARIIATEKGISYDEALLEYQENLRVMGRLYNDNSSQEDNLQDDEAFD